MKPAVKIVARTHATGRSRIRRRHEVNHHAEPMDPRTVLLVVGSTLGCGVIALLAYIGMRDARVLSTGLFIAVVGPMYLTVYRLKLYMPRAHSIWKREAWNIVLGVPLAVAVFYVWKLFPAMYAGLEDLVWRQPENAGGAFLHGVQTALDTAGGYLLGLILGSMLVAAQAAVWIVPSYFIAKGITRSAEDQVEEFYRQRVRQSTRQVVGRTRRLPKFKVGRELIDTKVQLRSFGMMLSLFSGLVTILALAWITPFFL